MTPHAKLDPLFNPDEATDHIRGPASAPVTLKRPQSRAASTWAFARRPRSSSTASSLTSRSGCSTGTKPSTARCPPDTMQGTRPEIGDGAAAVAMIHQRLAATNGAATSA
jgi:hypothetical protein